MEGHLQVLTSGISSANSRSEVKGPISSVFLCNWRKVLIIVTVLMWIFWGHSLVSMFHVISIQCLSFLYGIADSDVFLKGRMWRVHFGFRLCSSENDLDCRESQFSKCWSWTVIKKIGVDQEVILEQTPLEK